VTRRPSSSPPPRTCARTAGQCSWTTS
jgi:hypothetical protein